MSVRAVLFDLDCTLTDRKASVTAAAELFASRYVLPEGCTAARVAEVMWQADRWGYRDRREFFDEIVAAIGWEKPAPTRELLRFWAVDHPHCAVMAPGARELLEEFRARGMRLAIVTNGGVDTQAAKIRHLRLAELVDSVVISGAVGIHKPDRRIFDHALLRLGTEANEAVFVGDHPINDMAGAHGAGIRGVWIRGTMDYPADVQPPWRSISAVNELQAILSQRQSQMQNA